MTSLEYAVFAERAAYLAYAKALDDEAPVDVIARLHQSRDEAQTSLWAFADDIIAGNYSHEQTPLQAAALAALVAWRKADLEYQQCSRDPRGIGLTAGLSTLSRAERARDAAADALIASQEATS